MGEVYNGRFKVLKKLGWGHFSTVWYCDDLQSGQKVAMKVQKSAKHYTEAAHDEIDILHTALDIANHTQAEDGPKASDQAFVRLIDSFTHSGPNGNRTFHGCFVWHDCRFLYPVAHQTVCMHGCYCGTNTKR